MNMFQDMLNTAINEVAIEENEKLKKQVKKLKKKNRKLKRKIELLNNILYETRGNETFGTSTGDNVWFPPEITCSIENKKSSGDM